MERRDFLGFCWVGTLLLAGGAEAFSSDTIFADNKNYSFPPLLKTGAKVAFTAPGSPANVWEVRQFVNFFSKRGCSVIYGETITKRDIKYRYLSRDDKFRADELNNFFAEPSINCIVAARGGYGSIRILDLIDYDIIKQNPKIIIGFSDITVLLNAIYGKTNLVTFHGPTGNFSLDTFTSNFLEAVLFEKTQKENRVYTYKFSQREVLNPGVSFGRLVGGNLSNLVSLLGTEFEFDTNDSILFLEEVSEPPYKIDRMLKQLELAGKFKNCKGILLGNFGKLDSRRNFFPDYSLTLREIFEMVFKKYDFPVLINFPFGHSSKFLTFPIGCFAQISSINYEFSLFLYDHFSKKESIFKK